MSTTLIPGAMLIQHRVFVCCILLLAILVGSEYMLIVGAEADAPLTEQSEGSTEEERHEDTEELDHFIHPASFQNLACASDSLDNAARFVQDLSLVYPSIPSPPPERC